MVLAQWQMVNGKLGRQVVWPDAAKSARSALSNPVRYAVSVILTVMFEQTM